MSTKDKRWTCLRVKSVVIVRYMCILGISCRACRVESKGDKKTITIKFELYTNALSYPIVVNHICTHAVKTQHVTFLPVVNLCRGLNSPREINRMFKKMMNHINVHPLPCIWRRTFCGLTWFKYHLRNKKDITN